VYELSEVGSIGRKDTTLQVVAFVNNAEGAVSSIVVSSGDTIQRVNISDKAFKKVEKKKEVKVPMYSFEQKGRIDHFVTSKGNTVTKFSNVASFYNYTLPMMIFTGFGILALVFALLLKREDKKKGYGLELPNKQS
ncbi:MAG TPA: hypothetical protein PLM34_05035, partial [Lentimicrobium sp.]|nr:hypothetical protein [Lentimicrobium sp.]